MLSLAFIRDNPDAVKAAAAAKNVTLDVDRLLAVDGAVERTADGWVRTGSLCEASCHAAVSASFALEHLGPIKIDERTPSVRQKRYEWLKQRVEAEPVRS